MSAASERVDAFRRRAVELVNAGRVRVEGMPYSLVTQMADGGAYVELVAFVPEAAIAPERKAACWRRRGPCARCEAVEAQRKRSALVAAGAVGAGEFL